VKIKISVIYNGKKISGLKIKSRRIRIAKKADIEILSHIQAGQSL